MRNEGRVIFILTCLARSDRLNYIFHMNIKNITFFLLLSVSQLFAQPADLLIPGEMVIQFSDASALTKFKDKIETDPVLEKLHFGQQVSKALGVYLFYYDPTSADASVLTQAILETSIAKAAGQNFRVEYRSTTPSDEFFEDQQYLNLIQAPEAWDITTSLPNPAVIAIVEGADIEHEDLRDNIWTNEQEIPENGIDDDGNGYIDDYFGVNVVDSTDISRANAHSTSVAGVAGAKGNNDTGVSGILWDVEMMIVSHDRIFTKIVESYDYIYQMRKKYNETGGAEGAFVVATNSSFGVNNAFPDQQAIYGIWCEAYDLMGSVGILSATATNNSSVNIELSGDMPCLCPSDYVVAVTNTNLQDELKGGFGVNAIDIAAPGRVFTTAVGNNYSSFDGTSAATPVVTGAIGMMYAYPCEDFLESTLVQPDVMALQMKDILLESVDPIEDLFTKTVSGGRLNLFTLMQNMENQFGSAKGDLSFINLYPNPTIDQLTVEYQRPESTDYDLKVYDSVGRLVYHHFIPKICAPRKIDIPVSDYAPGVYFITIENNNNIESSRFVVH